MPEKWKCARCGNEWEDDGFEWPTECPECGWHVMEQVCDDGDDQP